MVSGLGLLQSSPALAHYPLMVCEADSKIIRCEVGFTDGSKAVGKSVRLIDYDENVLQTRKADSFSKVEFKRPSGDFYLQFDSGHEFPVEVDVAEL
ncbi:hypothetical protein ACWJJH_11645 [Endozoicomonadaceae bacterium StTr2]